MESGKVVTGFVVSESAETLTLRQNNGLSVELIQDAIDERVKQPTSMMPKGVISNLTPEQLADQWPQITELSDPQPYFDAVEHLRAKMAKE